MRIRQPVLDAVRRDLEAAYPQEGCGFLLGTDGDAPVVVDRVAVHNRRSADGASGRRYLIGPDDFRQADRAARAQGLDVIGVYHSHPNVAARPSEYDREHAWPWYQYLIVSVREGRAAEIRAWKLRDDRGGFIEHRVEIEQGAGSKER